jgi:hypothetical protein
VFIRAIRGYNDRGGKQCQQNARKQKKSAE